MPPEEQDSQAGPDRCTDPIDRILRAATIVLVLALGAAGLAMPASVLRGGVAWLGFLFCVLSGWGYVIVRIRKVADPDFGLRAAWGAAGYLAIAGALIAAGLLARPQLLALIGVGAAGFAWRELVAPVASWHRVRDGLRYLRARPGPAAVVVVLVALALFQMIAAVATLDRNPWDDDLAYLPLIKRLLDTGAQIEPFSFRRMGAYGGQTALGALAAARGTLSNPHLVDHALCFGIALLIVAGQIRERRVAPVWAVLLALVLLVLPDTSINTGAHWSGVVMFLALYLAVARDDWWLVGLVGAAACTLRQNYIAVVALLVGIVLARRWLATRREAARREAVRRERPRWTRLAAVLILALAGWWIAAFLSNRTILFPYVDGTWNHELSLRQPGLTWPQELLSIAWAAIEPTPIVVVPVLFALLAFTGDDRPGRPLGSFFVAVVLGFLALVHSFAGVDPLPLWRYAFGYAIALTAIFVVEVGAEHARAAKLATLGRWLLLAALALQLLVERGAVPKRFVALSDDLRAAAAIDRHGDPSARVEQRRYATMQAAIPASAPAVVLLDDPAYLDFQRNRIANLDHPGFASPAIGAGAQMPAFRGAEALREYLVEAGYPYAAFVRSERSRYFHRRSFWVWRLFNDGEIFQMMSAYAIDMIESLAELATTTKVLYDADGLVVLDLTAPIKPAGRRAAPGAELARRGAWVRELADREHLHDAWALSSRHDLLFADGIEGLEFVDPRLEVARWFEVGPGRPAPPRADADPAAAVQVMRGRAIRALHGRAHLRVTGDADMRLALRAQIALGKIYTRPRMDVSLDGELLASVLADERGGYTLDLVVPADRLGDGWHDLYLVFSSIAEPEHDSRDPRVAVLEAVEWLPAR
ncbi:MAG TPA: hypothetical protein VN253_18930 [Kofleriaceae bacterium]|nr:hypothetical protein [Kofleriaceae bacterium]